MIVIMSDTKRETIGRRLYQMCREQGAEACFISVSDRNVKPCYACGGCTEKSFGKCVVRDDMDEILPVLLEAEPLVLCFPLTFGGLSFDMKKVMDKTAVIGNPFYYTRNGEMIKGTIGKIRHLIAVGVKSEASTTEKDAFQKFITEFATITGIAGKSHLVSEDASPKAMNYLVREVMGV